jgi:hypothetical protein
MPEVDETRSLYARTHGRDILVSENVDAAGIWMDAGAGL